MMDVVAFETAIRTREIAIAQTSDQSIIVLNIPSIIFNRGLSFNEYTLYFINKKFTRKKIVVTFLIASYEEID
jgi:hypothetical protein